MKKAAAIVAVLVAIVAGLAFVAYERLDFIVKVALEHYGPEVAGVSVKVDDVELSPASGQGRLRGLEIGNPAGFTASRAARFGDIALDVDPATIRSDLVHVRSISVESSTIVYERADKATNLDVISRNIEAYAKRAGDGEAAADGQPARKRRFVIDRLAIRSAKVTMTNPALKGQGVTFDLPDIELRDVGRRGGATASQVAATVSNAIISRIAQRVLSSIDLLRQGGVEGAIDALKGLIR
jgi:hypothetical protein